MEFISTSKFDTDEEEQIWNSLKDIFDTEAGYCWHNHPITGVTGKTALPDIIFLHPSWGLVVIEIKGCTLDEIEMIQGNTWYMAPSFYTREIEPVYQATKHMWIIVDRLKDFRHSALRDEKGECKIAGKYFVWLPKISEPDWMVRFEEHSAVNPSNLIFGKDLNAEFLRQKFEHTFPPQRSLLDEDWALAVALIRNSESIQVTPRRPTKRKNSRAEMLRQVELEMSAFDSNQHRFAMGTPWGPQQLTGLAGTGKTIVLAQKAAYMHVKYPDWKIIYTFYSRSLYKQIEKHITRFVQDFSRGEIKEPDWQNIHVWHSWGAVGQTGLYRETCQATGHKFMGYTDASKHFGIRNTNNVFDLCCKELMESVELPELYDAILIDEGQDFDPNFYQMCRALLKQPKRIIWGYDVLQNLDNVSVPTPERLFGYDEFGQPIVSLDGTYAGDIPKEVTLLHCYRNPRPILIAAHTFGLGLKRNAGAVQFIDSVEDWKTIGYLLTNGAS